MYIVAIAWGYVVLMMSITEDSFIAGVMTFVLYGILPLSIILYIMGTPQRKRKRAAAGEQARLAAAGAAPESGEVAAAEVAPEPSEVAAAKSGHAGP